MALHLFLGWKPEGLHLRRTGTDDAILLGILDTEEGTVRAVVEQDKETDTNQCAQNEQGNCQAQQPGSACLPSFTAQCRQD